MWSLFHFSKFLQLNLYFNYPKSILYRTKNKCNLILIDLLLPNFLIMTQKMTVSKFTQEKH
jgi:hypothetical protein